MLSSRSTRLADLGKGGSPPRRRTYRSPGHGRHTTSSSRCVPLRLRTRLASTASRCAGGTNVTSFSSASRGSMGRKGARSAIDRTSARTSLVPPSATSSAVCGASEVAMPARAASKRHGASHEALRCLEKSADGTTQSPSLSDRDAPSCSTSAVQSMVRKGPATRDSLRRPPRGQRCPTAPRTGSERWPPVHERDRGSSSRATLAPANARGRALSSPARSDAS